VCEPSATTDRDKTVPGCQCVGVLPDIEPRCGVLHERVVSLEPGATEDSEFPPLDERVWLCRDNHDLEATGRGLREVVLGWDVQWPQACVPHCTRFKIIGRVEGEEVEGQWGEAFSKLLLQRYGSGNNCTDNACQQVLCSEFG